MFALRHLEVERRDRDAAHDPYERYFEEPHAHYARHAQLPPLARAFAPRARGHAYQLEDQDERDYHPREGPEGQTPGFRTLLEAFMSRTTAFTTAVRRDRLQGVEYSMSG